MKYVSRLVRKRTVMHLLLKWSPIKSLLMATAINFQSASNFNRRAYCIIYAYFLCTHAIIITSLSHLPSVWVAWAAGELHAIFLHSQHATLILALCTDACKVSSEVSRATNIHKWRARLPLASFANICIALQKHERLHDPGSGWFCRIRSRTAWITSIFMDPPFCRAE